MKRILSLVVAGLFIGSLFQPSYAGDSPEKEPAATERSATVYPVDYSIVSGKKFSESEKLIKYDYNGREILLLNDEETETFKKDPKPYIARLDSAIMATQLDSYPTDLCIVSGEKLGGMGKPVNYVYNNQLVRFCCEHCIDRFKKEPDKYMSLLSANTESKDTEEAKP